MMGRNKNLCVPNVVSINLLLVVGWMYVIYDAWLSSVMVSWPMLWVALSLIHI